MKYLLSILLVFSAGNSQSRIGDFQSISSFTHIISALFFDSLLVGVSKSGLIILNTEDESFDTVSIDNGLSYLDLTHLHKDIKKGPGQHLRPMPSDRWTARPLDRTFIVLMVEYGWIKRKKKTKKTHMYYWMGMSR